MDQAVLQVVTMANEEEGKVTVFILEQVLAGSMLEGSKY